MSNLDSLEKNSLFGNNFFEIFKLFKTFPQFLLIMIF